ncbi:MULTISPECIES: hypothetical protein [unclassified Streptomyces]|uniref:hypothetical protein n=1 Tax=unclassified Streptomyces TaxID=2593676 RepID=UPI0007483AB3|nr:MULTISPECIES: hypothetical protein [unclassified Streptomyces]KUL49024.1 hypothetical protein ADL30_34465 [Streptomyces sp. NRRL S-1521]THC53104.1 hypothetical protein E7X58_07525 [Streptomyces sp. A1499]
MARHAAHTSPGSGVRALLRAGLTLTAAGAALGVGGTAAGAAEPVPAPHAAAAPEDATALGGLTDAALSVTRSGVGPAKSLQLDPLANTGIDPLDNSLGTQVADFRPVSTAAVTDPVTRGGSLDDLPVVGAAAGLLPG